jgi:hypothetical protein
MEIDQFFLEFNRPSIFKVLPSFSTIEPALRNRQHQVASQAVGRLFREALDRDAGAEKDIMTLHAKLTKMFPEISKYVPVDAVVVQFAPVGIRATVNQLLQTVG